MMKQNKKAFLLIETALGMIVLILSIIMIQGQKSEREKIAVVIVDSDANRWSAFRYGLKMAAQDQDMELFVVSTGNTLTAEEEMDLVNRELENGSDGIIMQPVSGLGAKQIQNSINKKVPVMLVESRVPNMLENTQHPVVASDHYGMGKALAEELLKDFNGFLKDKTIGIVVQDAWEETDESGISNSRKEGFLEVLKETGAKISWSVTASDSKGGNSFYNIQPRAEIVIALDDYSLIAVAEHAAANNLHGALVYGIGSSTEAVYYLDTGAVECLVVPDEFMVGYQSLTETAECLRHSLYQMKGQVVSYAALRREELFSVKNQEILFTMSQGY